MTVAYIAEVQIILLCISLSTAHHKPAAWSLTLYFMMTLKHAAALVVPLTPRRDSSLECGHEIWLRIIARKLA